MIQNGILCSVCIVILQHEARRKYLNDNIKKAASCGMDKTMFHVTHFNSEEQEWYRRLQYKVTQECDIVTVSWKKNE